MFERLQERARRLVEVRTGAMRRDVAERLAGELPVGIEAAASEEGVTLSGRGLRRRLVLDPALRALIGRLR